MYAWLNRYWRIYRACANHLCSTLYIISLTLTEASVLVYVHYWNEPEMFLGFCIRSWGASQSGQGDGGSSFEKRFITEKLKMCCWQHWGYSEHPGGNQICFKSSCINRATSGPDSICLRGRLMSCRMVLWADIYSSLSSVSDKLMPSSHPKSSYVCILWACTPFQDPWGEWISLINSYMPLMTPFEGNLNIINSS